MKIISFYTEQYTRDANELIKSMRNRGIDDYEVELRESEGSWVKNTQIKAPFILEKLKQNDSVVWTDADSRVRQYPELFDNIKEDCAFFFMKKENSSNFKLPPNCILKDDVVDRQGYLQSGTMYFKNTPNVIKMLELWIELNDQDRTQWDQWTLQHAMNCTEGLTVFNLPPEYVWIDGISNIEYGSIRPVIYHMQASRRLKKIVG